MKSQAHCLFHQSYCESKEAPTFDGDVLNWEDYHHKLIAYLGQGNLKGLLTDKDPNLIDDFEEKNTWLFHSLHKNVDGPALTPLTKLPTNEEGETLPNGRAAWKALKA